MSLTVTIPEDRHEIAREASHEALVLLNELKKQVASNCTDNNPETVFLIRGLVHRLWTLNDVMYDALFDEGQTPESMQQRIGMAA